MKKSLMLAILVLINFNSLVFAQWVQTNGIYGGSVWSLAVSGTNLFAGTYGGGIFLSTNNGSSWTQVNTSLTNTYVWSLAVSGTNLFAGTRDSGVFLSTDNGTSWTQVNNGLTNTDINTFAVSGTNLFAGTQGGGVFLSTDNGTSWTQVNNGLMNSDVSCFTVSGTNLFAGTFDGGIFLSTNNGTSWTQVNNGLTDTSVKALAVSGSNLFAGTYGGGGVFLSTDNGTSWKQVNNGLTNTGIWALIVSGINIFAGTGNGGVFLSTNNGTSWTEVNNGLTDTYINTLAVSGTNLFVGTDMGGVFLSTNNGTSWTPVNNGLTNSTVDAFAVSDTNLFAGTLNGVFRSTDNGTNWTQVNNGLTNTNVDALAVSHNGAGSSNIFAGTWGGVFRSTDNGTSWTQVNNGLTNTDIRVLAVSGKNLFAGTDGGGVFLSTDNGTSWVQVDSGIPINSWLGAFNTVFALAVSPNGAGGSNLFAGTWGSGVFLSTNNGTKWTQVNNGLTDTYINTLAVSPKGAGGMNLFAGTNGGGVFLSTNNGTSWVQVDSGIPIDSGWGVFNTVFALAVSPNGAGGSNLFAGTRGSGVFLSTNNGTSWTQVNNGLTNTDIRALAVSGTNLFAGTYSGVWKRSLSEFITVIPTAGLQLWLKSDAGIVENNGRVSKWLDQSGNGNDAVETDTSRQPVLVNNEYNGKPVISFDGVNDRLGFTGSKKMSQLSVFAVFKNKTPDVDSPAVGSVFTFGPGGAYNASEHIGIRMRGLPPGNDNDVIVGTGDGPDYVTATSTNMSKYDEWRNISFVTDDSLFNTTFRWNGNDAVMAPSGSNLPVSVSLGDSAAGGGGIGSTDHFGNLPFPVTMAKCDFAELIVYDTVLTDSARLAVEKYLNDKYNITITGVEDSKSEGVPAQFTLYQNYPNPFNPSTTIKYSLPKVSFVTLKVYDILGREVTSLVNEEKTAGNYRVVFNASSFASGVYFYRIEASPVGGQAGSFIAAKKLLLLK